MESDDAGLVRRIEDKLADPEAFRGSREQEVLLMTVSTAMGEGLSRRRGKATQRLGGRDIASAALGRDDDPASIIEGEDEKRHLTIALRRALNTLKRRERMILKTLFWEGLNQAELARELGISPQTINDIVKKAVRMLATQLDQSPRVGLPAPAPLVRGARSSSVTVVPFSGNRGENDDVYRSTIVTVVPFSGNRGDNDDVYSSILRRQLIGHCPSSEAIVRHALGLPAEGELRAVVADHVVGCVRCQIKVLALREAMRAPLGLGRSSLGGRESGSPWRDSLHDKNSDTPDPAQN